MNGSMKKVCSLDFLNLKYFEADIKTADGRTVISQGSQITPELLLKLYFKDIYIQDGVQVEDKPIMPPVLEQVTEEIQPEIQAKIEQPIEVEIQPESIQPEQVVSDVEVKTPKQPAPPSLDIDDESIEQEIKAPKHALPDIDGMQINPSIPDIDGKQKMPSASEDDINPPLPDIDSKSPKQAIPDIDNKSINAPLPDIEEKAPVNGLPDMDAKAPKQALPDIEDKVPTPESKFNSMAFDIDEPAEKPSKYQALAPEPEPEPEPEEEKDPELKFDKEQAERMAQLAAKIGKTLKLDSRELDDLRKAAFYCNIGIISFRKSDTLKRDFEIHKALESAEMAKLEGKASANAIETIRLHPNDYDSTSFSLNQKIPHYHIIGMVYFYEKMIQKLGSKKAVLERMLQLGGNKFNIFVLHKFIRMMKETNE